MKFTILTLFPEMFPGPLEHSIIGKALLEKKWEINVINIRDFAFDKHKTVDSTPYGGGAGMVIRPDVIARTVDAIAEEYDKIIYMSPRGRPFDQLQSLSTSKLKHVVILCGRYEGIDQRVIDHYKMEEVSIGDYILTGGEIPAFALMDSCIRNLENVLGNQESREEESFSENLTKKSTDISYCKLLEYPIYTKPQNWRGMLVPEVLVSGDHGKIKKWRINKAKEITKKVRPDLVNK